MTRTALRLAIFLLIIGCSAEPEMTPPPQSPSRSLVSSPSSPMLRPVDQAGRDPSFLAFRMELLGAIARRDRDDLLSVLDPNILVSFGGDEGIEDFKRYWRLDEPTTEIWDELGEVLRLGGAFQTLPDGGRRFCAPYVYSAYPEGGPDPFQSLVVIAKRAELHDQPSASAPVVALLEYDIVSIEPDRQTPPGWRKVRTARGKIGWIEERFIRSHLDYRACFEKRDGDWKMVLLLAGD